MRKYSSNPASPVGLFGQKGLEAGILKGGAGPGGGPHQLRVNQGAVLQKNFVFCKIKSA